MPFPVGSLVLVYGVGMQLGVIVADASGSTVTGVVAGVAGTGILGGVGVQMLRNMNKSERFHDAQIARHVTEIERQASELEAARTRCDRLEARNQQLESTIADLRAQLAETRRDRR